MASKLINSILARLVGLDDAKVKNAKREIMTQVDSVKSISPKVWAKYGVALGIVIEAGVLKQCKEHNGSYFRGNEGIEKAYKLGNAKFTAGELKGTFESRREMTDKIKDVIDQHNFGMCDICATFEGVRIFV